MNFNIYDFYNPWWKKQELPALKEHLLGEYNKATLKRDYSNYFDTGKNGLYILKGPRQVGKSTLMRYTIYDLLQTNPGRSIFYIPADTVKDFKELRDILFYYLRISEKYKKRYIFIDEITYIKEWQRALKELRDNTVYKNDFFLVTGSSAWDLKRSGERMPGRRGEGEKLDRILLPMNFREYIKMIDNQEFPLLRPEEILKLKPDDEIEFHLRAARIRHRFDQYLKTGGFLMAVECILNDRELKNIIDVFWDIIIGDIERMGLERSILIRILRYLGKITGNRFSFTSVSQDMEIDVKTVQRYLYGLGYNFMGILLPFLDKNTFDIKDKKMKKFYFVDSFIYEVLLQKTGVQIEMPLLVECAILKELLNYAVGIEDGLCRLIDLGYWYSDKGKEVDFLAGGIAIECKFRNRIREVEKSLISKQFNKGILLSKDEIDFSGDVKVMPVHLFLSLVSP
jgi:predicted AAA+ superfamily ATPase